MFISPQDHTYLLKQKDTGSKSTVFNLFTYHYSDKKNSYFPFLILKTHFGFPRVHEKWTNI